MGWGLLGARIKVKFIYPKRGQDTPGYAVRSGAAARGIPEEMGFLVSYFNQRGLITHRLKVSLRWLQFASNLWEYVKTVYPPCHAG